MEELALLLPALLNAATQIGKLIAQEKSGNPPTADQVAAAKQETAAAMGQAAALLPPGVSA